MFIINQFVTSKEWDLGIKLKEKRMLLCIINGLQMIFYLVVGTFSGLPHVVLNIDHGVWLHVQMSNCRYYHRDLC